MEKTIRIDDSVNIEMMMMIAWNFHGTILAISDESIVHAFLLLSTYVVAVAIIIAEYCHKSMKTKKKA